MANKRVPEISEKQKQIVETAATLFMSHGIKRVTIEEICRKAAVSKMTFYKYFANKIELVKHIWNNWVEEGFEKLAEIDVMDIPFPEKMELMFNWKQEFVLKRNVESIEEFLQTDVDLEKIRLRFLNYLVDAQKRDDIRPGILPEFIMAVIDKLYELTRDKELMKKYPTYIEFRCELKDFLWYGLVPRPQS